MGVLPGSVPRPRRAEQRSPKPDSNTRPGSAPRERRKSSSSPKAAWNPPNGGFTAERGRRQLVVTHTLPATREVVPLEGLNGRGRVSTIATTSVALVLPRPGNCRSRKRCIGAEPRGRGPRPACRRNHPDRRGDQVAATRSATGLRIAFTVSLTKVLFDATLGLVLWLGPRMDRDYHTALGRTWGPSLRDDQIFGAGILWGPAAISLV